MKTESIKQTLKRITDETLEIESSFVEPTLNRNVYNIYTEVWTMTIEQFDKLRTKIAITDVSVDGFKIMLTVKV